MMNELDKFYKENIEKQHIRYKPEYWSAAADYIAQQERNLIRRRLAILTVLLLLISGAGIIGYYGYSVSGKVTILSSQEKATYQPTDISVRQDIRPELTEEYTTKQLQSDHKNSILHDSDTANESETQLSTNIHRLKSSISERPDISVSDLSAITVENNQTLLSDDHDYVIDNKVIASNTEIVESKEKSLSFTSERNTETENPQNGNIKTEETSEQITDLLPRLPISHLNVQRFNSIEINTDFSFFNDPVSFRSKNTVPGSRWVFNAGLPLSLYGNLERSRVLGLSAQVGREMYLSSQWSLFTGLGYGYRSGPVGIQHDHPTIVYHFEKQESGYALEVNQLHALQLPVMISYHTGSLLLGLGWQPAYIGFARGSLKQYTTNIDLSQDFPVLIRNSQVLETGNVSTNGIKRWAHELFIQGGWQWSTAWRSSIRMAWLPGGLTDSGFGQKYDVNNNAYYTAYNADRPFMANAIQLEIFVQYLW
jgi:hypothetical protein